MEDARESLVEACRREPVTLFLGAGISHSRGVPLWNEVVQRMVAWVGGSDAQGDLLARVRDAVAREIGPEIAARVALATHPLEPQLALEWVAARLADEDVRRRLVSGRGEEEISFAALLRRALYEQVDSGGRSDDALSAVSRALRAQHDAWPARRVIRVVTLNADDLLERAVCADGVERVVPIARPGRTPRWSDRGGPPAIPVYHVHGYLPQDPADPEGSTHTLVFTDDQFWSTTTSPLSFANRVVANALHDSQCVFAGISMRDVNVMRWLAVRYEEVVSDARAHGEDAALARRHFWIHPPESDPTGILTEILHRRGVASVTLPSWEGAAFAELLDACFSARRAP